MNKELNSRVNNLPASVKKWIKSLPADRQEIELEVAEENLRRIDCHLRKEG